MANFTLHKPILLPSKLITDTSSSSSSNSRTTSSSLSSSSSNSGTTSSSSSSSSQSFSTIGYEINPNSYTSFKDLLPSTAIQTPSPHSGVSRASSGYEISIRNRLVKQAAWAYLQPMSVSPDSVGQGFVHRIWIRLYSDVVNSPLGSFLGRIIGFFERALGGICIW